MSLYALSDSSISFIYPVQYPKSHSRLPGNISWVASGIVEIVLQAIQPVAVIPFLRRLRCFIVPQIASRVDLRSEVLAPLASPYAQFHLVMGIVRPSIVQDYIPCLKRSTYVT